MRDEGAALLREDAHIVTQAAAVTRDQCAEAMARDAGPPARRSALVCVADPGSARRQRLALHLLAAVFRQFDYLAALAGSLMRLAAEIQ